jgi:hypothetical protein
MRDVQPAEKQLAEVDVEAALLDLDDADPFTSGRC